MSVDKMYGSKELKTNFKGFFEWKKTDDYWISEEDYLKYVKEANLKQLIKDSRFMIETYYQY